MTNQDLSSVHTANNNLCMWCQKAPTEQNPFIKCHLIPKYFFREINDRKPNAPLISLDPSAHESYEKVKRTSSKGAYDSTIICDSCETNTFKPIDNNAINLFFNKSSSWEKLGQEHHTYDYPAKDLYTFILSILWRLDVSQDKNAKAFKGSIHLGPYREKVKKEIKSPSFCYDIIAASVGPSNRQPLIDTKIHDKINKSFIDPIKTKDPRTQKTTYTLIFSGFLFAITLGKTSYADTIKIKPKQDIIIPTIPFDNSPLADIMHDVAKSIHQIIKNK